MLQGPLRDIKALLGRYVPETRQMLRKLIDGRVVCQPFQDDRGKGYEFTATGTYAGLLRSGMVIQNGGGGQGFCPCMTP